MENRIKRLVLISGEMGFCTANDGSPRGSNNDQKHHKHAKLFVCNEAQGDKNEISFIRFLSLFKTTLAINYFDCELCIDKNNRVSLCL